MAIVPAHIRPFVDRDETAICDIYNHYIRHTVITFEEAELTPGQMRERMDTVTQRFPWLVCERDGQVVGYAYASLWKQRAAYRHSAELTVYVRDGHTGQGLGEALYTALIEALRQQGDCHVLLGCIALPNAAIVALHERLGFVPAGQFREVGRKFDQWLDVGYWCLQLPTPA
jgi:phosphinothricin acetyltransferase